MSRTDPQFNLRIPEELRERVMSAAKANKRSATAEIIARLEDSFLREETPRIDLEDKSGEIHSLSEKEIEAALLQLNQFVSSALKKRKK
ncbi:Arc family DNA-binding protein [Metapseudomonas sp. CR1201]